MPKQGSRAEVNTFVKGLITEASPLNFPANASFDEINFELKRDGTRQRRLGMDFEPDAQFLAINSSTGATSTFVWSGAGGITNKEFLAIQIGNTIYIHDLSLVPISSSTIATVHTNFDSSVHMSFAAVNGSLIVAAGYTSIMVINFNPDDESVTAEYQSITVRDVWGIKESDATLEADPSVQPTVLTPEHTYNLYNQSWGIPRRNSAGALVNPVTQYFEELGKYPSSTETIWSGLAYQPVVGTEDPYERMYSNLYAERLGADNNAAKGYFIINLLARNRLAKLTANRTKYSQMTFDADIPEDVSTKGASCVTEFAGRVFYAGFGGDFLGQLHDTRSPVLNNYIFFSKLVRNTADITKCYQEGDPTSRDNSDVVDTDGGFIRISGAKRIIAARSIKDKLVVLADNGVWVISGGSDFGFSATNYKVDKRSIFGCINAQSVIVDGTNLLYWGDNAIYGISPSQYGELVVDDLTAPTIQTLYDEISDKSSCFAVYDPINKKLRWVYKEDDKTKELIFDTVLKCFYQHQIFSNTANTIKTIGGFSSTVLNNPMYVALRNSSGDVTYTFAQYSNTSFRDWNETDAAAYLVTGATTAGDSAIEKQTPYVVMHMRKTETGEITDDGSAVGQSSCKMRAQWNWANKPSSHKFGPLQEVYRYRIPTFAGISYDSGLDTVVSKSKLRGRGKALSLYFETSPLKDCQILGWSLTINGNAN